MEITVRRNGLIARVHRVNNEVHRYIEKQYCDEMVLAPDNSGALSGNQVRDEIDYYSAPEYSSY